MFIPIQQLGYFGLIISYSRYSMLVYLYHKIMILYRKDKKYLILLWYYICSNWQVHSLLFTKHLYLKLNIRFFEVINDYSYSCNKVIFPIFMLACLFLFNSFKMKKLQHSFNVSSSILMDHSYIYIRDNKILATIMFASLHLLETLFMIAYKWVSSFCFYLQFWWINIDKIYFRAFVAIQ